MKKTNKKGFLYRLDFSSGMSYIGITIKSAEERYAGHAESASRGSKFLVHVAWREYGPPRLIILATLRWDQLPSAERKAVKKYDTFKPNGYNMTPGGHTSPNIGRRFGAETRARMSAAKKGKKLAPEHVEKIAAKNRGQKRTQETKALLSTKALERNPANHYTPFCKEFSRKHRKQHLKAMRSPEVRKKLSISMFGKKQSPEHIANAARGRSGRHHSKATKAKIGLGGKLFREFKIMMDSILP